ncbi:MAG TPA: adenine phosphoribosyltransferase [Erysipelotrichaceae bacterium]|nr:adenine phosphoribosyltransferase [Erysipelotrichaceae bacterium]
MFIQYTLKIAGLTRKLPIIRLNEKLSIASFVVLGDAELIQAAAPLLVSKLPEVDLLVGAEAKGIPLLHEMSRLMGLSRYVVVRKSIKAYMQNAMVDVVQSITTTSEQIMVLDRLDVDRIKGKRVALIDDVISTGSSLATMDRLVEQAGGYVVARAALLAEGDASLRDDIIFLEKLPIFD